MQSPAPYSSDAAFRKEHDQALFRLAYPSGKKELLEATVHLKQLSELQVRNPYSRQVAGLRGSVITGSFSFALVRWLNQQFPHDTEIESSGADAEMVRLIFRQILPRTEYDRISAGELDLLKRIKLLKGAAPGSMLNWLLEQLNNANLTDQARESLFHSLQLFIRCRIMNPVLNVSMLRGPASPIYFQQVIRKKISISAVARKKLPAPRVLRPKEKENLVNIARASLLFLYRETEPFTYASTDELHCFELEKGVSIVLYGMIPERRLSIESYIGYLAFSNCIPVAYGGGWLFGKRCQFGINIFPAFRGGPSSLIMAQLIRVYHQYFGAERFMVKPYQFGWQNPEAIKTGAFWFYYKAGFRPESPAIREQAMQEWLKIKKDRRYRTDARTLREFTRSAVSLSLSKKAFPAFDANILSHGITDAINRDFGGNRQKALQQSVSFFKKQYRGISMKMPDGSMQKVLEEWSLLAMMTLQFDTWSRQEKEKLLQLIRLKTAPGEIKFIHRLAGLKILWKQWGLSDFLTADLPAGRRKDAKALEESFGQ